MTVIRPNSITGVTSITAQGDSLTLHRSDGTILDELKSNINASSGVSTVANLDATNINASGIVTAASFVGDGSGLTGVASTDNINTDTTATFNGNVSIADSIIHTGDTDTSIRFPATDTFTVETAGSERVRITSAGLVGVGTAAPRSALDLAEKTDAVALPQGTTAQRPTGDNPYLRWNTTNSALEFYNGTDWVEIISDYFPSGSTILG